jgi:MFS family permease
MMRSTLFPLGATLAVQMLVAMAVVTVPVLAPVAAIDAGVSAGYVGLFVAIVYGASMVSSLVSGNLIQKYGPIRVSQLCLISCAAGLACVVGATPALIVGGAVLLGFGYGPVTPASSHLLSQSTPPHMMSLIFSLKQTGVPLGGALAGAVVPSLVLLWGWRVAALVVGMVCIATAALAQPIRHSLDAERASATRIRFAGALDPLRFTIAHPAIRRLALCSFFFASIQVCLTTYLVTYLTSQVGYPPHGRVPVAAPLVVNDEAVRLAVIDKLGWIKRQKAKFAHQPRQSQREMVNGESHYFLGQRYRLRVHEHDASPRVAVRGVANLDLFVRRGTSPDQRETILLRWHSRAQTRQCGVRGVTQFNNLWNSKLRHQNRQGVLIQRHSGFYENICEIIRL